MRPLTTGMHPDEAYTPRSNPRIVDYPDHPLMCDGCRDNEADCDCECCTADHDRFCTSCCPDPCAHCTCTPETGTAA